jgi:flagellar hook capping protein FlgD
MHPRLRHLVLLVPVIAAIAFVPHAPPPERVAAGEHGEAEERDFPSDYFYVQRAMPDGTIPTERIAAAVEQLQFERALSEQQLTTSSAQDWVPIGPFAIGGRVNAIVAGIGGAPAYLGAANGGVWRSEDLGFGWVPLSDKQGLFSIGSLALNPFNANTVWCGTGDANATVDGYDGTGLYRSRDGGFHWEYRGLRETAHISAVVIDPTDSNKVFVGAMGKAFSTDPNRGFYRSLNGGATWTRTLFVNDSTGVSDVEINPAHPETIYCSTWERVRRLRYRRAFGVDCAVWRSADGGGTWTKIVNGLPLAGDNLGRIAIAVAPSQPSRIYASVTSGAISGYVGLGLFRSDDGGENWFRMDTGFTHRNAFGGFSWYFGMLEVNPIDANDVWTGGVRLLHSTDGGVTLSDVTGAAHVDHHALWIDPIDPAHVYLGNDGGFYFQQGGPWQHSESLPITQFYAGTVDAVNVNKVLGGAQDNGTSKTETGAFGWGQILGADGFQCLVNPPGSNTILAEWQYCCDQSGLRRSTNNGVSYTPTAGWSGTDRYNWNTPFVASAKNRNTMIAGSHRVYKSTNTGVSWSPVSGDLTSGPGAQVNYGTITTVAISPADSNLYLAGTDDGHVWRSQNGGAAWEEITAGLPSRYVTRVVGDPFDAQVIYATHSGFGEDLHDPRVFRSANRGDTWTEISGNLPDAPVNDLIVDPVLPGWLYAGTDLGVFVTRNLGQTWTALGGYMPIQPVWDLELHEASRRLYAFTHGRSVWMLDLGTVSLSAPAPNPARGAARFEMRLAASAQVDVSVFDAAGRRVRVLAHGTLAEGRHPLAWDARDERGSRARAGVYFVRASDGSATRTQRLVIAD